MGECGLNIVAKHVHLSPSYLSSLFKQNTGVNFTEYVVAEKMKHARQLLLESNCKLEMVSEQIGYHNTKNLIRAFRKYYGTSPGRYKREQQTDTGKE